MSESLFSALLIALIPQVVSDLMNLLAVDEGEATGILFDSRVYELLEDEETALWHLGPRALAEMVKSEYETGDIAFPEEV